MSKQQILKTALALAVLIFAVSASDLYAWRGGRKGGPCYSRQGYPMFRHLQMMKVELGLSDKQVEKIFAINQEYRKKYFQNRGNPEQILKLRLEHRKAVESVLTKEQLAKYKNLQYGYGNRFWRRGPFWY